MNESVSHNGTAERGATERNSPDNALPAKGRESGKQAKDPKGEFLEEARHKFDSTLQERKATAASQLERVSGSLKKAGQELKSQECPMIGDSIDRFAGRVERFSKQLREKDIGDLLNDASRYARQRPEAVLGGALLAGFLAGRFLKSSSPHDQDSDTRGRSV